MNSYKPDIDRADISSEVRCVSCGTTLADLYKDGLMGCTYCYDSFRVEVQRALIVLHGEYLHIGKQSVHR